MLSMCGTNNGPIGLPLRDEWGRKDQVIGRTKTQEHKRLPRFVLPKVYTLHPPCLSILLETRV